MKSYAVTFAAILSAALAAGCDRIAPEPTSGVGGAPPSTSNTAPPTTPGTATPPTAGASDPSLPPAGPAVAGDPATTERGADTKTNAPESELSKREESSAMPKPGQANNHSTPNRGTTPTKP